MYLRYWNLKKKPYLNNFDRELIFFTPLISKIFNLMLFSLIEIEAKAGLVLTGDRGSGKTHLIYMLQDELKEEKDFIIIECFNGFDKADLFKELSSKLKEDSKVQKYNSLIQILNSLKRSGQIEPLPFVLALDNAHLIEDQDVFQELDSILNFYQKGVPFTNIILSGGAALINKLEKGSSLLAKTKLIFELENFSQKQIANYINHKLHLCGKKQEIFTPKAIEFISEYSNGDLRIVNYLCRLGIIAAAQNGIKSINADIISSIITEYNLMLEKKLDLSLLSINDKNNKEKLEDFKVKPRQEATTHHISEERNTLKTSELTKGEITDITEKEPSPDEKKQAQNLYYKVNLYISEIVESFENKDSADLSKVELYSKEIVNNLKGSNALLLEALKPIEGYDLARHLINVAIISVIIGRGLAFNGKDLINLAQVAILHDVGMIKMPRSLIEKPSRLTEKEFNEIKKHPTFSYQLIKSQGKKYEWIADIAYQEHERDEGSGYPQGLIKEQIHEFARIIGVADYFEAYSHNRPWRKRFISYNALQEVIKVKDKFLPADIIKALINELSIFPLNSYVQLNNGEIGKVVSIDKNNLTRPVVQIVFNSKGKPLTDNKKIILSETHFLFITKALKEEDLPI